MRELSDAAEQDCMLDMVSIAADILTTLLVVMVPNVFMAVENILLQPEKLMTQV